MTKMHRLCIVLFCCFVLLIHGRLPRSIQRTPAHAAAINQLRPRQAADHDDAAFVFPAAAGCAPRNGPSCRYISPFPPRHRPSTALSDSESSVSPTPVAVKASTPPQSVSPLALVYMAMMLGSWLGGAYLLQGLQTATGAASTFQRPFFLTWVTQVAFSGMLVLQKLRTRGEGSVAAADDRPLTTEERVGRLLLVPRRVVRQVRLGRLVTLSSILLLYRWLWTLSLQETAVSLNTALFNSHVFMVFLLSAIFLNERVTAVKLLAVVCGSLGVLYMTGLKGVLGALLPFGARAAGAGASIGSCSLRGCLLTILSAVAYSVYAIAYKQWVPAELTLDVVAGQGTTALTALPLFPLLHATSVERLALPPIPSLMPLAALAVGGLAYYLFYSLALSQASPLFVAIGQMLILPVAALIDTCVKDVRPSSDELIGAGLILLAFGGLAGGGKGKKED